MRPDDLAPLLAQRPADALGFRVGTVTAFDAATASNTINVGGTLLLDVPVLNSSEVIALESGDHVGLLRSGSTYFIVGKVTTPGEAVLTQSAAAPGGAGNQVSGFTIDGTPVDRALATVPVPPWARAYIVHATVHLIAHNDTAASNIFYVQTVVGTNLTTEVVGERQFQSIDAGKYGHVSASAVYHEEGTATAGEIGWTSLYLRARCSANSNIGNSSSNKATTRISVTFFA